MDMLGADMTFRVICEALVLSSEDELLAPEILEAHLDTTMDELLKLDGEDPDIGAALALGTVSISIGVEAPTPGEAAVIGGSIIRTAIHAAGGHTPDWSVETLRLVVESPRQQEIGDPRAESGRDLVDA